MKNQNYEETKSQVLCLNSTLPAEEGSGTNQKHCMQAFFTQCSATSPHHEGWVERQPPFAQHPAFQTSLQGRRKHHLNEEFELVCPRREPLILSSTDCSREHLQHHSKEPAAATTARPQRDECRGGMAGFWPHSPVLLHQPGPQLMAGPRASLHTSWHHHFILQTVSVTWQCETTVSHLQLPPKLLLVTVQVIQQINSLLVPLGALE